MYEPKNSQNRCSFKTISKNLQWFVGNVIRDDETPGDLEMEEDDAIEVFREQKGGNCEYV